MSAEAKNYHHWVQWSETDQCFIGFCPDLSNGGLCHDEDPKKAYAELLDLMEWHIELATEKGLELPEPSVHPPHPASA